MGGDATGLWPLILFAVIASATPGPNNLLLAGSGAAFGLRRSVPQMAGALTGFMAILAIAAFGLGELLRDHPGVQQVLRWLGVAYLLHLAFTVARASGGAEAAGLSRPIAFGESFLFQAVNPKGVLTIMTAVAAFSRPGPDVASGAVPILLVFGAISVPVMLAWVLFGRAIGQVLTTPTRRRLFNLAMGAGLAGSAIAVLFD